MNSRMLRKLQHLSRQGPQDINLNPLQRGGVIYPEARHALLEWADGYAICDFCDGRLDQMKRPPISDFVHTLLPQFLDIDVVRITHGAREGKFAVMHALCHTDDTIVIDGNAHYSTYVAAERSRLRIRAVPNSGYPYFTITPEAYAQTIQETIQDTGTPPALVVLTYPDGSYGNLVDAKQVAKIAHEYHIPFLLNAAYAMGRMPLSAQELDCDFIVGSGHKSMASSGPIGILGMKETFATKVLQRSAHSPSKELELLGCTARGAALVTLMASFPSVVERITTWEHEVAQLRWFAHELEQLGLKPLGETPHNHDLLFIETPIFYQISQQHPKKRFFLYHALKQHGISGIKAGLTRNFKVSTYRLSQSALEHVLAAFQDIIDKNTLAS
jgi:Sep-tRNA:Cys-tRNA synthetase